MRIDEGKGKKNCGRGYTYGINSGMRWCMIVFGNVEKG